ncbi:hypothetical protein CHS0354_012167 [Potamilus streckersoni]|uniref:Integrin alpha first immunoglubulin-like domain-containing protein n=1 Tax=Potamilus streckersoni TaxID=2493646 RepID=A0AAE0S9Z2_9BIVA|nr:hypothetical protein CHS0354_012167 [Potamilus streckersoni]
MRYRGSNMKKKFRLVNYQVLLTLFVWGIVEVRAFNVDVEKPIYFQEEKNAMFGYTVAFIPNSSGIISLLVGAPNRTGVDGIKGYGGFYECEINSLRQKGSCQRRNTVDIMCQKFRTRYKCEDYQMLGATIAVNHKYQDVKHNMNVPRVSVCAPGWKYTLTEKYGKNFTLPVGKCYHFKETWQYESCENEYEYCIPFWKKPDEYFLPDGTDDFALAMGGFSMKYSQDGRYSFIGGPGVKEGRGAVKSHQISREHIFDRRKDGLWVQYFGFSLTTADFKEHGSVTAGIPNYHPDQQGFTGRVEVFSMGDFTMKNALNFGDTTSCDGDIAVIPNDHPQSGSKFGYVVEGINVDGKGMDELFVGAPFYSDFVKKRVVAPETGRVFVYRFTAEKEESSLGDVQGLAESQQKPLYGPPLWIQICGPIVVLTGAASDPSIRKLVAYARFGTAISSAGDLNHDGYKDVAIGAPYEDEHTGAVYIYNGGTDGVKNVFSQRITGRVVASNTPGSNIQTFGWHINGEYDVDKNGFTDLAIGAYKNDVAIILRTRPVVNVTMDIRLFPNIIPLNGMPGSACGDAPCLRLMVCFSYIVEKPAPVGVADKLNLQYDVEFDTLSKVKNDPLRVKFQNDSNAGRKNITLVGSIDSLREECRNATIVVKKNGDAHVPNDLWTPVRFAINFTLLQPDSNFSVLDPVLKPEVQSTKIVEANFDIKCENKSSCQSDLELAVEVRCFQSGNWALVDENTKLVVGDARELELTAKVTNRLDSAFRVDLVAQVLAPLKSTDSKRGVVGALCQDDQAQGVTRSNVTCTANGKLDVKQYIQIVFKYDVSEKWLLPSVQDIAKMPQEITILVQANQANTDVNQTNNIFNTTIPVRLEATVEIIANKSMSEQVEYKNDPESDRTLYILHRYHLINHGPSPLINATIIITVPIANNDKTLAVIKSVSDGCNITQKDGYKRQLSTTPVGPTEGSTRVMESLPVNNLQRQKRDNSCGIQMLEQTAQDASKYDITCVNYQYHLVTCNVSAVKGDKKKTVDVNINIAEKNIPSDKSLREITYISRAEVSDQYVNFRMPEKLFAEKRTRLVISQISIPPNDINIWIIIGSVAGGILLLIIVIIILWKFGFFKRKQHKQILHFKKESLYQRKSSRSSSMRSEKAPQLQS